MKELPNDNLGISVSVGGPHYRAFVGPPEKYDIVSAMQFNLLTSLGLRDYHQVLDIGCGSLRFGRLLIPYLQPHKYCGIEPEEWLVNEGIKNEIGQDLINIKSPQFIYTSDFTVNKFNRHFDFVVAQSIFSHASKKQIRLCLKEVALNLNEKGIFAATYCDGNVDYLGEEWVYPGCVEYTAATISKIADEMGLKIKMIDWPHPNGQSWVLFFNKEFEEEIFDPTYLYCKGHINSFTINEFIENLEGTGFCDQISEIGDELLINGWGRNPYNGLPATNIIIFDHNKNIVGSTLVNTERKDVELHFKDPKMLTSGWKLKIKKKDLPIGNNKIYAYVYLSESQKALKLNNDFDINL